MFPHEGEMTPDDALKMIGDSEKAAWLHAKELRRQRTISRWMMVMGLALAATGPWLKDWWVTLCAGWILGQTFSFLRDLHGRLKCTTTAMESAAKAREGIRQATHGYMISPDGKSIRCFTCGFLSQDLDDVKNAHCPNCHRFHERP